MMASVCPCHQSWLSGGVGGRHLILGGCRVPTQDLTRKLRRLELVKGGKGIIDSVSNATLETPTMSY